MAAACGTTGDIKNNLMKLLREVQRMRLGIEPDTRGLSLGAPSALLPILHAALLHYSLPLASWLSKHDYDLYCKNDLRFIEGVYKVLREVFHYNPRLSKEQFLTVGYAERKMELVTELLRLCQNKHSSLAETQSNKKRRGGGGGGRGGGRHEARGRGRSRLSEPKPISKREVLTVQSTVGISSAWSEPIVTRVRAVGDESRATMSSLPHYSLPPCRMAPSEVLELTPSPPTSPPPPPPPLIPTSSSSFSSTTQPVVIRHEAPPTRREIERGTVDQTPQVVVETLVLESLSPSSAGEGGESGGGGGSGGGGENKKEEEMKEERISHNPGAADIILKTSQGNPQSSIIKDGVLVKVSERLEELAGQMEKMSACFVLLETRVKTIHCIPEHKKKMDEEEEKKEEKKKEEKENETKKKVKEIEGGDYSNGKSISCSKEEVPVITNVAMTTVTGGITVTPSSKRARSALVDLSNPRPTSVGSETTKSSIIMNQLPHPSSSSSSNSGQSRSTVTPSGGEYGRTSLTTNSNSGRPMRERALSRQLARIRNEERIASPSPPPPALRSPASSSLRSLSHSTPVSVSSCLLLADSLTTASPEETASIIANLRDRAQRTKEFLKKANHRL